ncbi:MAG: hypothetical protein PHH01_02790 [Patescibacteria group bacterium]|nr:hypothetical protein [Patescibacteria group bacterium]
MNGFEQFEHAFDRYTSIYLRFIETINASKIRFYTVRRAAASAKDIFRIGRLLRDQISRMKSDFDRLLSIAETGKRRTHEEMHESNRISDDCYIVFKSFLFFARLFQDNLYQLLYIIATGNEDESLGSMQRAVGDPKNPVVIHLKELKTGYLKWFSSFRQKRDEIKKGYDFSASYNRNSITMRYAIVDDKQRVIRFPGEGKGTVISLEDVAECYNQTCDIIDLIVDLLRRENDRNKMSE